MHHLPALATLIRRSLAVWLLPVWLVLLAGTGWTQDL